jgi:predicted TIM-barrel fold metal-dependent hydrolase
MRLLKIIFLTVILIGCKSNGKEESMIKTSTTYNGPIIDMHVHLDKAEDIPKKPTAYCIPLSTIIENYDPKDGNYGDLWWGAWENPQCENPIWFPKDYDSYQQSFEDAFVKHNVLAVMSGTDPMEVLKWHKRMPDHVLPSLQFRIGESKISPDSLRVLVENHGLKGLGEITNQYHGIELTDSRMFPYYELAQELDIPVGIHMGSGLPGISYYMYPNYRASLSNPLELEDLLLKFPKLRIYIMHYAEPFIDELITVMIHHPQVYVDIGGIHWFYPREYFYEYHLKKLVAAGFGKRILFGSDLILAAGLLEESIDIINDAPFLTYDQKADIFYNNAARFLRLE